MQGFKITAICHTAIPRACRKPGKKERKSIRLRISADSSLCSGNMPSGTKIFVKNIPKYLTLRF